MIKIKNWSKYQSYKDRKPPWIRFHRSIVDDYKYQMMTAESRALLPMLWLLACEHKDPTAGVIDMPMDEMAFRLRRPEVVLVKSVIELQATGFIQCNETVTKPLLESKEAVTPETETETETNTEKSTATAEINLPTKDQLENGSPILIKQTIADMVEKLYSEKIFDKVHAFKNKMQKDGMNDSAILHVLSRCYIKGITGGFDSKGAWGYGLSIMKVENGNYNERDHSKTAR